MSNKGNWKKLFVSAMALVCCGLATIYFTRQRQADLKSTPQTVATDQTKPLSNPEKIQIAREDVYFQKAPTAIFENLSKANITDLLKQDYTSTKVQIPNADVSATIEFYPLRESSAFYIQLKKMNVLDKDNNALYVEITPEWGSKGKGKYIGYGKAWYVLGKQGENLFIYAVTDDFADHNYPLEETNLNTKELFSGHYESYMNKVREIEKDFMRGTKTPPKTEKTVVPDSIQKKDKGPALNSEKWRSAQIQSQKNASKFVNGLYSRQAARTCPRFG